MLTSFFFIGGFAVWIAGFVAGILAMLNEHGTAAHLLVVWILAFTAGSAMLFFSRSLNLLRGMRVRPKTAPARKDEASAEAVSDTSKLPAEGKAAPRSAGNRAPSSMGTAGPSGSYPKTETVEPEKPDNTPEWIKRLQRAASARSGEGNGGAKAEAPVEAFAPTAPLPTGDTVPLSGEEVTPAAMTFTAPEPKPGINIIYSGSDGLNLSYRLERSVLLGRDPARCAICVSGEGIADVHCRLTYHAGKDMLVLEDLGSPAGTLSASGVMLEPHKKYLLRRGSGFCPGSVNNLVELLVQ